MSAMNGSDVLILVNTGTAAVPIYEAVGSQRDMTIEQTSDEIDTSNKTSGRYAEFMPGRYSSTVSFESMYVPNDGSYAVLRASCEYGLFLKIRREYAGVAEREADAFVTSLSESFPDQEPGVVSASMRITGPWRAV
jgi:predicted secreted protein